MSRNNNKLWSSILLLLLADNEFVKSNAKVGFRSVQSSFSWTEKKVISHRSYIFETFLSCDSWPSIDQQKKRERKDDIQMFLKCLPT